MFTVHLTDQAGDVGDCIYLFFPDQAAALKAGLAALEEHEIDRKAGLSDQYRGWAHGFKIVNENNETVFKFKGA